MNEKLPELTDEERVAMERCDVSEILGTWEERFHCAKNAALRWFRERNELRTQLAAAEAHCEFEAGIARTEYGLRIDSEMVAEKLQAELNEARDAARWWYRRDRSGSSPSIVTDQLEMWPWLDPDGEMLSPYDPRRKGNGS